MQHIFLDESGKPEVFSASGTNLVENGTASRHLVLAAVKVVDHIALQKSVTDFKSSLLSDPSISPILSTGYALDSFHATNDYPSVRKRFYEFICSLEVEIHAIVVDKPKLSKRLQKNPSFMYGLMAGLLLRSLCHQEEETQIVFSRKDSKLRLQKELSQEVERMRQQFISDHPGIVGNFTLSYNHNPHYSHAGLQVADYIAYSLFQLYERGNPSFFEVVKGKIRHIHDVGQNKHFTRSRPLKLSS